MWGGKAFPLIKEKISKIASVEKESPKKRRRKYEFTKRGRGKRKTKGVPLLGKAGKPGTFLAQER